MGKLLLLLVIIACLAWYFFSPSPSPVGAPNVTQSAASGATSASPTVSVTDRLRAAAARTDVQVTVLQENASQARIRVDWTGDVAANGGDFIDALINDGVISDFDQIGKGTVGSDRQGRQTWAQEFNLKLKSR